MADNISKFDLINTVDKYKDVVIYKKIKTETKNRKENASISKNQYYLMVFKTLTASDELQFLRKDLL